MAEKANKDDLAQDHETSASTRDLERQLHQLRTDMSALAETVAALGSGTARGAKRRASDIPEEVGEYYEEALDGLRKEYGQIERKISREVRSNPLPALGVAAAIGFLFAHFTRR